MSYENEHRDHRLETADGELICYLYPMDRFEPSIEDTETTHQAPDGNPGDERAALVQQGYKVTDALEIRCTLFDTDTAPMDDGLDGSQADDVRNLFGVDEVTRIEVYNRIAGYLGRGEGAPYRVLVPDLEATASSFDEVDREDGIYPAAILGSVSTSDRGKGPGLEAALSFQLGIPEDNL